MAINGFGRIGRNVLRALVEDGRSDVSVVAINDLAPPATNAHLLRYDSVHGRFPGKVTLEGDVLDCGTGPIKVLAERTIENLPWQHLQIDVVLECTGVFTKRDDAARHLDGRRAQGAGLGALGRAPTSRSATRSTTRTCARTTRWSRTRPAPPTAWPRSPRR